MAIQGDLYGKIESAAGGNVEDMRTVLQALVDQQGVTNSATGNPWNGAAGSGMPVVAAPPAASFTAVGGNGVITVSITNPTLAVRSTIYNQVAYSSTKNFTQGVTTLPTTSATSLTVNAPGETAYFRIRTSTDQKTWSAWVTGTVLVSAGMVSSAATTSGSTFNQTNYANVGSIAVGSTANVLINGAGGVQTSLVAVKGTAQAVLPSATIINVEPATDQFVGWNGTSYTLHNTLAAVLDDNLTPIGKVSVVNTGAVVLPTIKAIINTGSIVGFDVTNEGNGIGSALTITITDSGGGSGATAGAQNLVNGKLASLGPGQPGGFYTSATVVTASGGVDEGVSGGGTTLGGNGGRLTAV
jgi:hypothetical protein